VSLSSEPAVAQTQSVGIDPDDLLILTEPMRDFFREGNVVFLDPKKHEAGMPIEGHGNRMMWLPYFGAFRAGGVDGDRWNGESIGHHSVALGFDVQASGEQAVALGTDGLATGDGSIVLGTHANDQGHSGGIVFGDRSAQAYVTPTADNQFVARAAGGFVFHAAADMSEEASLYILPGGDLGVGTCSPESQLHIHRHRASREDPTAVLTLTDQSPWNALCSYRKSELLPGALVLSAHQPAGQGDLRTMRFSLSHEALQQGRNHLRIRHQGNMAQGEIHHDPEVVFDLAADGAVGIRAVANSDYALSVGGSIRAREIVVESDWADYVFAPDYELMPLPQLANYIAQHGHLPGVPTAQEVSQQGVSLGQMQSKFLEKIEELTLYSLRLKKENDRLRQRLDHLGDRLRVLEQRVRPKAGKP